MELRHVLHVEVPREESALRQRYRRGLGPRDAVGRLPHDHARLPCVATLNAGIDRPQLPVTLRASCDRWRHDEAPNIRDQRLRRRPLCAVGAPRQIQHVGTVLRLLMSMARLDHLAIVQTQLVRGGVVCQLRVGKIPMTGFRHRIGHTGRHSPIVAGRTCEERRVLDPRIAIGIRREREPEPLSMPRRGKLDGAGMDDLPRALVGVERDWNGSAEARDGVLETLGRRQGNFAVAARLEDAIGTATRVKRRAEESNSAEQTSDMCASVIAEASSRHSTGLPRRSTADWRATRPS